MTLAYSEVMYLTSLNGWKKWKFCISLGIPGQLHVYCLHVLVPYTYVLYRAVTAICMVVAPQHSHIRRFLCSLAASPH